MNVYVELFLSLALLLIMVVFFVAIVYNFYDLLEVLANSPAKVKYTIILVILVAALIYYSMSLVFLGNIVNILLNKL